MKEGSPVLTPKQRSFLKSRAHDLEPLLQLGKAGVTEGFLRELETALAREELVKIRIGKFVDANLEEVASKAKAELVAEVGRTAILYRPGDEPGIVLPAE
jgi:RNA-binding protein